MVAPEQLFRFERRLPVHFERQRIAAPANPTPPLGKELGKLLQPPPKELAKHVPMPIPGFAPTRRVRMLKSRSRQGKAGNTAIPFMTRLCHGLSFPDSIVAA